MEDQAAVVERLVGLFAAVGRDWEAGAKSDLVKQGGLSYLRFHKYDSAERVAFQYDYYGRLLSCVENLEESAGCDLGCWLGFSTALQAARGCRVVYGVDIRPAGVREAEDWSSRHGAGYGVDNLRFRPLREGVIPLLSKSVDWVIINQVLCNAPPGTFLPSLREAHRVLKPGGTLIMCDGNNPYCPRTEERLKKEFSVAEVGDGTLEKPEGLNFNARRGMISEAAPALNRRDVRRLARETCYLWGTEVTGAARRFAVSGESPGSVFDPESLRTPLLPHDGAANGNITDPFELSAQMESVGFGKIDISSTQGRKSLGNEEVWKLLGKAMVFCIFADKPE